MHDEGIHIKEFTMPIQWRDQFSVGNDLIDADHKYLLEIINKAESCLNQHQHPALVAVLEELTHYGQSHFEREELVARAVGYPKADQLHHSHDALVQSLAQFRTDLGESWTPEAGTRFAAFLRDWLVQHVIKEDLPMKPWMAKFSPRFDPRT
ncbi:MAG: hemerythrin [Comamonadaceae bacterium CG12_big_fil_rev_8_21_14_0_65_59_15]|nr:MAG: hemerythrin [Comamonadaceae bacterium CG12_big_fil_rev_8_21_14_0_65_59_15]